MLDDAMRCSRWANAREELNYQGIMIKNSIKLSFNYCWTNVEDIAHENNIKVLLNCCQALFLFYC